VNVAEEDREEESEKSKMECVRYYGFHTDAAFGKGGIIARVLFVSGISH
jgi:hypothetical protein